MSKLGVLLINLGTPKSADPAAVYTYLKQFLNDPRVIDLPSIIRWILVNGLIIPFRYKKSAAAYQKIWMPEGSPLLFHSEKLREQLAQQLGEHFQVEIGMRYGEPSIASAVKKLNACEKIMVLPLFPQYASAATGSALEETLKLFSQQNVIPSLHIQQDFYQDPHFIAAYTNKIAKNLSEKKIDLLILSYHGLPERHITQSKCRATCDKLHACPTITSLNRNCYRAQCYETSRQIAQTLNLNSNQYQVSFQSRLGRTPWIKPYTDQLLPTLIQKNIKRIAIASPSFVADCLETLEEINMQARAQWEALGGEDFIFIPSLNTNSQWINALIHMIKTTFTQNYIPQPTKK